MRRFEEAFLMVERNLVDNIFFLQMRLQEAPMVMRMIYCDDDDHNEGLV